MNKKNKLIALVSGLLCLPGVLGFTASARAEEEQKVLIARVDCADVQKEVDSCKAELASCNDTSSVKDEYIEHLHEICPNIPADDFERFKANRAKKGEEKKAASGSGSKPSAPKPSVQQPAPPPVDLLICVAPAVESVDHRSCSCPNGGTPARLVDLESKVGGRITKGECVTQYDEYAKKMVELDDTLKKACLNPDGDLPTDATTKATCQQSGANQKELVEWYRKLIRLKIPLNDQTWNTWVIEVEQIINDLHGIKAVYCPATPECKDDDMKCRCAVHEKTFCKEGDTREGCKSGTLNSFGFDVGPAVMVLVRPGAQTTIGVGGEMGLNLWTSRKFAIRPELFAGYGFNSLSQRLVIGGATSAVFAFDDQRVFRLHLGVVGIVEPNDVNNDASTFGGRVAFHMVPRDSHLFLDLGVGLGAGKYMRYPHGVRGTLSDWGFVVAPSAAFGFAFGD